MGEILRGLLSAAFILWLGYRFGGRKEQQKQKRKEREQEDAFEEAIENSHSGGAAWLDRLRETDPLQRGGSKSSGAKKRADGKS